MKKITIVLLIYTILCATVYAQNEKDFKINDNGTITGYEGWDTAIVIPAKIGGITVTGIKESAFKNMGLTSVTLPAGIKYIGKEAFASNKITTVTIPAGVYIYEHAFSNNKLTSITIGNEVDIDRQAFSYNELTSITVGNEVDIDRQAFSYNELTSITVGNDVFINNSNVFEGNSIKNIVLGMNVNFSPNTFDRSLYYEYMCNSRKAETYDNSVRYAAKREEDYSFIVTKYGAVITNYYGHEGSRLIIPRQLGGATVKGIGVGGGDDYYGKEAFYDKSVSRMQLPDSIVFIGHGAFQKNRLTSVIIPDSVTHIYSYVFSNNQLTNITIPNSVTFIGNSAFSGNQLTSVTIGNNVISIGESAFMNNKLTTIIIPNNVTSIGNSAFYSNPLANVTFNKSGIELSTDSYENSFDRELRSLYKSGGEGTYIKTGSIWAKKP